MTIVTEDDRILYVAKDVTEKTAPEMINMLPFSCLLTTCGENVQSLKFIED